MAIDMEHLRSFIGTEYPPPPPGLPDEPVRRTDILNYAEATEDRNPLWRDDAYAQGAGLPGAIAPPGFVETVAPNYRAYHMWAGTEHLHRSFPFPFPFEGDRPRLVLLSEELLPGQPVRAGDVIIPRSRVADIQLKHGRSTGDLLIVTFDKTYTSPDRRDFGTMRWTVAALERELSAADQRAPGQGEVPDPAAFAGLAGRRGAIGALRLGTDIGFLQQPLSMTMLIKWTAVLWDMGIPHFDAAYMQQAYGLPAPLAHGPLLSALHRRVLTDWLLPADRIAVHRSELRAPSIAGDTVFITLRLDSLEPGESGGAQAMVSSTMVNQHGRQVSRATATCVLSDDARRAP